MTDLPRALQDFVSLFEERGTRYVLKLGILAELDRQLTEPTF